MKRFFVILMCIVMALIGASVANAISAKTNGFRYETVLGECFTIDKSLPQEVIGVYDAISIDWPRGSGKSKIAELKNAVGHFAFGDKFNDGDDIYQVAQRKVSGENSLPVPHNIHDAFYNNADFSWLFTGGMDNFYFNLTKVQHIDAGAGAWQVFRKIFTGWMGATSHEYHYFMIFDTNKRKVLTSAEIFNPSKENVVIEAIVAQMMKNTGTKTLDELRDALCFLDEVKIPHMPKNIGYNSGNFIFVYNPYEISCGSVDYILVQVPARVVRDALTKAAKKALGL